MKLPNGDRARIDDAKLVDYCLNADHADGRHKALLFERVLGINREVVDRLRELLLRSAREGEAVASPGYRGATKYRIDFPVEYGGHSAVLRSVWEIRAGEDEPRLITCFPESQAVSYE